jgi:Fe-S-cluster-containing dehydrogenase component
MNESRREFLRGGLIVAGALGAGLGASKLAIKKGEADSAAIRAKSLTPVLTPTGELRHIDASQAPADAPQLHSTAHSHSHSHSPASTAAARVGVPGRKWVMVIDLAKCSGCATCTTACAEAHDCPPDRQWIKVFKMQDSPNTAPYWFPKPCFHCDNPPCTKVCPVGATYKREDGIVLIDNERCIGCRFCMAACPYSTRYFNWGRSAKPSHAHEPYSPEKGYPRRVGTAEKCDFCPEMAKHGQLPHCITACDMGALYFGDQNEDAVTNAHGETLRFSQLMEERAGYRYLEDLGTEPRVFYLPPKGREFAPPVAQKAARHAAH